MQLWPLTLSAIFCIFWIRKLLITWKSLLRFWCNFICSCMLVGSVSHMKVDVFDIVHLSLCSVLYSCHLQPTLVLSHLKWISMKFLFLVATCWHVESHRTMCVLRCFILFLCSIWLFISLHECCSHKATGCRRINRTIQPFNRVYENLHKITFLFTQFRSA